MEKKATSFLYLDEEDMIKAGVLDSARCVDVIDEVFRLLGKGDYVMGGPQHNEHGMKITFPDNPEFPGMPANGPDRRFMAMVAYLGGRFNVCGEKWYGSNIINPSRGLPRSVLMVMLNDPDTCEPLALMSGNLISAMRTGAVPGVGARYLAKKDAKVCAVIGAGPVNKACFKSIHAVQKSLEKIVVYDLMPDKAADFCTWAKEELGIDGAVAGSTEEAVRAAEVITVAASSVKPVVIEDEWLQKGSLIMLTGLATLPESYLKSAKIVFDNSKMHMAYKQDAMEGADKEKAYNNMIGGIVYRLIDAGKLPTLDQHVSLGDVMTGAPGGRESDDDRVCFITSGMAVEDVGWGFELYSKAKEMGLGQTLKLWDGAHWI